MVSTKKKYEIKNRGYKGNLPQSIIYPVDADTPTVALMNFK